MHMGKDPITSKLSFHLLKHIKQGNYQLATVQLSLNKERISWPNSQVSQSTITKRQVG